MYDLLTFRGYRLEILASALQKAIRRGDAKLAGIVAFEIATKYRDYLWRRLMTIAAEDCYGLVEQEIIALYEADKIVQSGRKEKGRVFISKAVVLLCREPKCRDADHLTVCVYGKHDVPDEEVQKFIEEVEREYPKPIKVPQYVYDCHTKEGRAAGKTKDQFIKDEFRALEGRVPGLFDEYGM